MDGEPVYFAHEGDYVVGPLAEPPVEPPERFTLLPPWPNPGRAPLSFAMDMPAAGKVTLCIYDLRGRRLRRLRAELDEGRSTMVWNGRDDSGKPVAAGLYLARAEFGTQSNERKLVLLAP